MKLTRLNKIIRVIKLSINWIGQNLQTFINILLLIIGFYGIYIANKTLKNAKLEHKQNTELSESLFQIQKQELESLQEITNNQIDASNRQLKEYIFQTRPKLALKFANQSRSSSSKNNDYFTVKIELQFKNVGGRTASNIEIESVLILSDFSKKSEIFNSSFIDIINPEEEIINEIELKATYVFMRNYYVYTNISYYDEVLKERLFQKYYFKYDGGETGFIRCNPNELKKIKYIL